MLSHSYIESNSRQAHWKTCVIRKKRSICQSFKVRVFLLQWNVIQTHVRCTCIAVFTREAFSTFTINSIFQTDFAVYYVGMGFSPNTLFILSKKIRLLSEMPKQQHQQPPPPHIRCAHKYFPFKTTNKNKQCNYKCSKSPHTRSNEEKRSSIHTHQSNSMYYVEPICCCSLCCCWCWCCDFYLFVWGKWALCLLFVCCFMQNCTDLLSLRSNIAFSFTFNSHAKSLARFNCEVFTRFPTQSIWNLFVLHRFFYSLFFSLFVVLSFDLCRMIFWCYTRNCYPRIYGTNCMLNLAAIDNCE